MYRTKDQVASEFITEGQRRGITVRGIVICIATGLVESNLTVYSNPKVPESEALPHDADGSDGFSVGPLQQQIVLDKNGYWWADAKTCMNPTSSCGLFYDRLAKLDYNNLANSPGSYAQAVQGSAFPLRYDQQMAAAQNIYDRLKSGAPVTDLLKPAYNEFAKWSPNSSGRGGTKVDAVFLHTQEGGGGDSAAEDLANFLDDPASQVSYHYTLSQASDGGVTVVDVVDTANESWSVLSANSRSINYCFAGSSVNWTTVQWMQQSKAIDVAAYLIVQDCQKYGIPTNVIPPPYAGRIPGISDHAYVTKILGDGTHTDVGPNFPWAFFTAAVKKYSTPQEVPVPTPKPAKPTDPNELTSEVWDQLRISWPQLGNRTLVDAVAAIMQKLGV